MTDGKNILFAVDLCQQAAQCIGKIQGTYFSRQSDGNNKVDAALQKDGHTDHRDQLEIVGEALLEYETLTGDEIKALIAGEEIRVKPKKSDN